MKHGDFFRPFLKWKKNVLKILGQEVDAPKNQDFSQNRLKSSFLNVFRWFNLVFSWETTGKLIFFKTAMKIKRKTLQNPQAFKI